VTREREREKTETFKCKTPKGGKKKNISVKHKGDTMGGNEDGGTKTERGHTSLKRLRKGKTRAEKRAVKESQNNAKNRKEIQNRLCERNHRRKLAEIQTTDKTG